MGESSGGCPSGYPGVSTYYYLYDYEFVSVTP